MRAFIRTFGCTFNRFDSELIEFTLRKNGLRIVKRPKDADIVIVNTCGVKKQTEDKIISYLNKIELLKKKLIVTGCLPLINLQRLEKEVKFHAIAGPSIGAKIMDVINGKIRGEEALRNDSLPPLRERTYRNKVIHIVPISHGCLGNCSYCGVKFARGNLRSYSEKEILSDIKKAVRSGIREIWITAQDSGVYGLDIGTNLINLLRKVNRVEGEFFVRIGMGNPSSIIKILDELIYLFTESEKFFHFLHIPVQSGSDKILEIMRRPYSIRDFKEIVYRLRREVDRKFCIATDVIVGHPGETEDDFMLTMKLIKETKPDVVNISKFFPRPGTNSSKMKPVPTQIIKQRSVALTALCNKISYDRNKMWIGWVGNALVDEHGKNGTLIARNHAYKPIITRNALKLGQIIRLKVKNAHPYWLCAELVKNIS